MLETLHGGDHQSKVVVFYITTFIFGSSTDLAPNMLEFGSQESVKSTFQHLANFLKSWLADSLTADVWDDFTPFLLRIRTSSLNKNYSWYIGLSFRFKVFARWSYGLAVKSSSILAVMLIRARLNRNEPPSSVADRARAWPPRGADGGRASPLL